MAEHSAQSEQEGPWIPALSRRMTPAEIRLYRLRASLEPDAAVEWIGHDIGPYDAGRAIAAGRTPIEELQDRERRGREAREAEELLGWTRRGIPPAEAAAWTEAGFTPADREWLDSGFTPELAAAARRDGKKPGDVVLVWGILRGRLQIGLLSDFERIDSRIRSCDRMSECRSWSDLRQALGRALFESEFGELLNSEWERECDQASSPMTRHPDWLPATSLPQLEKSLRHRPRFDDPSLLNLPAWLMDAAKRATSPAIGDRVWWEWSDVGALSKRVHEEGLAFTERQDLVDCLYADRSF